MKWSNWIFLTAALASISARADYGLGADLLVCDNGEREALFLYEGRAMRNETYAELQTASTSLKAGVEWVDSTRVFLIPDLDSEYNPSLVLSDSTVFQPGNDTSTSIWPVKDAPLVIPAKCHIERVGTVVGERLVMDRSAYESLSVANQVAFKVYARLLVESADADSRTVRALTAFLLGDRVRELSSPQWPMLECRLRESSSVKNCLEEYGIFDFHGILFRHHEIKDDMACGQTVYGQRNFLGGSAFVKSSVYACYSASKNFFMGDIEWDRPFVPFPAKFLGQEILVGATKRHDRWIDADLRIEEGGILKTGPILSSFVLSGEVFPVGRLELMEGAAVFQDRDEYEDHLGLEGFVIEGGFEIRGRSYEVKQGLGRLGEGDVELLWMNLKTGCFRMRAPASEKYFVIKDDEGQPRKLLEATYCPKSDSLFNIHPYQR